MRDSHTKKLSDKQFTDAYHRVFSYFARTCSSSLYFLASPYSCLKRYDKADKSDYSRFRYITDLPLLLASAYGIYCITGNIAFLFYQAIKLLILLPFSKTLRAHHLVPSESPSGKGSCLIVSHLNSALDFEVHDDFYFPGLTTSLMSFDIRPSFVYTNKPGFDTSVEVLLATLRGVPCSVIPQQPSGWTQICIYFQRIINDVVLLLYFFPRLFFLDSPSYAKRFLAVLVGSSRHSVSNLWLYDSLLNHLSANRYDHVVFPFEGNSWEAMLCLAARQSSHSRLHAYCHTEVRPDFSFLNPVLSTHCSPDHFLVSHECFIANLLSSYPSLNTASFSIVGFTSIYRSLIQCSSQPAQSLSPENASLIFCPDGFLSSSLSFIDLAAVYSTMRSRPCVVCLHPSVFDKVSGRLPDHPGISIHRGPVCPSLLSTADALVYQSSTVALVAAYLRIPVIFFEPQNEIASPLAYLLGSSLVARSVADLAHVVDNLHSVSGFSTPVNSSHLIPYDPHLFAVSILQNSTQ